MTALDLDAIKARAEHLAVKSKQYAPRSYEMASVDVPALIGEVERLRDRIDAALRVDHHEYDAEKIINGMREHLLGRNDSPPVPCPECGAGKHANCDGTTWDAAADALTTCPCFAVTVERGEDHARRFGGDA